jgi:hypothetical protein
MLPAIELSYHIEASAEAEARCFGSAWPMASCETTGGLLLRGPRHVVACRGRTLAGGEL